MKTSFHINKKDREVRKSKLKLSEYVKEYLERKNDTKPKESMSLRIGGVEYNFSSKWIWGIGHCECDDCINGDSVLLSGSEHYYNHKGVKFDYWSMTTDCVFTFGFDKGGEMKFSALGQVN